MRIRNHPQGFGLASILIHWITATTVFGMFGLGLWMTELSYYDPWYRDGPVLHKGIGVLLFLLTLTRLIWVISNPKPLPPPHSPGWERAAARITHGLLYVLLFTLMTSGYLISTADGRGVPVFGWFEIPALPWALEQQEEIAGEIHEALAFTLIGLVGLHAAAALKHHFIDKDSTLRRMLWPLE